MPGDATHEKNSDTPTDSRDGPGPSGLRHARRSHGPAVAGTRERAGVPVVVRLGADAAGARSRAASTCRGRAGPAWGRGPDGPSAAGAGSRDRDAPWNYYPDDAAR